MSGLKLSKLPDTTPVKHTFTATPGLHADLEAYARVYQQTYGEGAKITDLIPSMLASFMASDTSFKKARKQLN